MSVAIVGMACRVPGGDDAPAWVDRMESGAGPAFSAVPASRWDASRWTDPELMEPRAMVSSVGGFLPDLERVDLARVGLGEHEASCVDPREILLRELARSALHDAGEPGTHGERGGLYVGMAMAEHLRRSVDRGEWSAWLPLGAPNVAVHRVSGWLGWTGPSLGVDMGCASSLAAIDLASRALLSGEIELALAGGAHAVLSPLGGVALSHAGLMSPSGQCRPFHPEADGWVRGEGGALLALMTLERARAEGRRVLATIEASVVLHSGRAASFETDRDAIARALREVGAAEVDYVEAHGVGVVSADAAEARALAEVFDGREVVVGAAKAWTGHLEWAAGAASTVKAVCGLRRRRVPRQPDAAALAGGLRWPDRCVALPEGAQACVHGFALGGSHAALRLAAGPSAARSAEAPRLWTVTAPSEATAIAQLARDRSWLAAREPGGVAPARGEGSWRWAAPMAEVQRSEVGPRRVEGVPRVALVFAGQGTQRVGMGEHLRTVDDEFRAGFDEMAAYLEPLVGVPLREVIADARVHDTRFAQPALLAFEWGLARAWQSRGVEPGCVLGHSVGELVALAFAGACTPLEIAQLVAARGAAMAEVPRGGSMAAALAPRDVVEEILARTGGQAEIAAINGEEIVVVSGPEAAVEAVTAELDEAFYGVIPLETSHAFHSRQMEPALAAVRAAGDEVRWRAPAIPVVSNLEARPFERTLEGGAIAEHVRGTVRFSESLRWLREHADVVIEIGPGAQMSRSVRAAGLTCIPSLLSEEALDLAAAEAELFMLGGIAPPVLEAAVERPPIAFARAPLAALDSSADVWEVAERVAGKALDRERGLMGAGLDSAAIVEIAARMGVEPAALFEEGGASEAPRPSVVRSPAPSNGAVIVGMACRFPGGVEEPRDLWDRLERRIPVVGPAPDGRGAWPVPAGGFLDDPFAFDERAFGVAADRVDPHHRLLLEVATEALEHAGLGGPALQRAGRVGVFVARNGAEPQIPRDLAEAVAGLPSSASGEVAHRLGLRGPAVTIDTACSGSLVAAHLAVRALLDGECDVALAGGVSLQLHPQMVRVLLEGGALARDGVARAFEPGARGYVRAEGCGVIVLRRDEERTEGAGPLARWLGSAVGHDGASQGYTAPSGAAQQEVVSSALARAGLEPDAIGFVEAHGTGTPIGDPIEARALSRAFAARAEPLPVTASKRVFGHAEAAAGVLGLIVAVEALRRGRVPGQPPRESALEVEGLRFPSEGEALDGRAVGVSSFGMTGTNAHAVVGLVEPATTGGSRAPLDLLVLPLSAPTEPGLERLAARHARALSEPDVDAESWCASAWARPSRQARRAVAGRSAAELVAALRGGSSAPLPPAVAAWAEGTTDALSPLASQAPLAHLPPTPWDRGAAPTLTELGVDSLDALARGIHPDGSRVDASGAPRGRGDWLLVLPPGVPEPRVEALMAEVGAPCRRLAVDVDGLAPAALETLRDHLAEVPAVVVGWSLGGRIAASLVGAPGVRAAVVVDAAPRGGALDPVVTTWMFCGSLALRASVDGPSRATVERRGVRRSLRQMLEHCIEAGYLPEDMSEAELEALRDRFGAGLERALLRHEVSPSVPCVVVRAADGPVHPDAWATQPASIPGDHYSLWSRGIEPLGAIVRQVLEREC